MKIKIKKKGAPFETPSSKIILTFKVPFMGFRGRPLKDDLVNFLQLTF